MDIQNLKLPHGYFIAEEVAIVPLNEDVDPKVLLFKKARRWKDNDELHGRHVRKGYDHGLGWVSSDIPYNFLEDTLRPILKNAIKIVMGWRKKLWLEEHFDFGIEIQDIAKNGLLPLDEIELETACPHHNGVFEVKCALHNVRLMKKCLSRA